MYGIRADLKVYLEEPDSETPSATFAGRIEKHLEREVESITSADFLTEIQSPLQQADMKHVIMINRNDVTIYDSDEESEEDWEKAFETAMNEENSSKGTASWWVLVSGWNGEFKFRQDIEFQEKHVLSTPSMTVVIRALPAEWALQPGEAFATWMTRLQMKLGDKEAVEAEENLTRPKIEKYLQDYQELFKGTFPVREISQNLRIKLSDIDWKSFGPNYSTEQAS
jgi:hypothetical protein